MSISENSSAAKTLAMIAELRAMLPERDRAVAIGHTLKAERLEREMAAHVPALLDLAERAALLEAVREVWGPHTFVEYRADDGCLEPDDDGYDNRWLVTAFAFDSEDSDIVAAGPTELDALRAALAAKGGDRG